MTPAEMITIIISILSLIVAIISWCISHYVNKRMLGIEEKREQDRLREANTGKVKVVLTKDNQFLIYNEGPIDIEVTEIFFNGIEIRKHPCFEHFDLNSIKLPTGSFYSLSFDHEVSMEPQYLPPFDVQVKWKTSNGDCQQQEMTVNWI